MKPRMRDNHPWRQKGEKHPASKLSEIDRQKIVYFRNGGFTVKQLAAIYSVCPATIYRVCRQ